MSLNEAIPALEITINVPESFVSMLEAMKTYLLLPALIAAIFLLNACASPEEQTEFTRAGTYELIAVDGKPLPALVQHGSHSVRVESGELVLTQAGQATSRTVFGPPEGDSIHREVQASFTQSGSKLNLTWKGAGQTIGEFSGDQFTMNNEGMLFSYSKR